MEDREKVIDAIRKHLEMEGEDKLDLNELLMVLRFVHKLKELRIK